MDRERAQRRFDAFRDRLFDVAASSIERATAPIVHINADEEIIDNRTGVFLEIDGLKFLISAGHGMVDHFKAELPPYVVMSKDKIHPIALVMEYFWTTKNDDIDLTVTKLEDDTARYLADQIQYLRLGQLMLKDDPRQLKTFYTLAGFPHARYARDEDQFHVSHNWKYITHAFDGDYSKVWRFNSKIHLILKYDRDSRSTEGKLVHPPGLSGCGVWHVGNPWSEKLFTAEDFRLVGIQTAWNEDEEYAKCTWIDSALRIIWEYYPATHAAIRRLGWSFA